MQIQITGKFNAVKEGVQQMISFAALPGLLNEKVVAISQATVFPGFLSFFFLKKIV